MKKIAVIGDYILDKYTYGDMKQRSEEVPLPMFRNSHSEFQHGGAGNVAMNCHHHADTTLFTATAEEIQAPFKLVWFYCY